MDFGHNMALFFHNSMLDTRILNLGTVFQFGHNELWSLIFFAFLGLSGLCLVLSWSYWLVGRVLFAKGGFGKQFLYA